MDSDTVLVKIKGPPFRRAKTVIVLIVCLVIASIYICETK